MTLFINACVRGGSRTKTIADAVLRTWGEPYEEVRLSEVVFPMTDEDYLTRRAALADAGEFDHPMFSLARQFARADKILIAAPYWDLSFPASLKQYIEHINAVGVTFRYTPEGIPEGLCRAGEIVYVTTAGGHYVPEEFGYGYIRALAEGYWGIPEVRKIQAEGLDILGADAEGIVKECVLNANANAFAN